MAYVTFPMFLQWLLYGFWKTLSNSYIFYARSLYVISGVGAARYLQEATRQARDAVCIFSDAGKAAPPFGIYA